MWVLEETDVTCLMYMFYVELKLYIKHIHKEVILLLHNIYVLINLKKIHQITKMCVLNMKRVTIKLQFQPMYTAAHILLL